MSGSTSSLPTVLTTAGLQPQSPASLLAQLIAAVVATNPGYTANLPGSLVEDVSSTDVAGVALCDSARVELVNSLTPYGANAFILTQLGTMLGIPLGQGVNTSVYVVFSSSSIGYVINAGFYVSDGTYQYVTQDAGVIATGGSSQPIYCIATQAGTWSVGPGTVNSLASSVPTGITLTVTNPEAGVPSTTTQTEGDYRAQVIQGLQCTAQGMPAFLRSLVENVPGVSERLVSVRTVSGGEYEVIVGGGDPYQVAGAIYEGFFDIATLVGSTMSVSGITNANPAVVTTALNHGFATGQAINIAGVLGMTAVNGGPYTITVLTPTTFSLNGVNSSGYGAYTSGGVVTPNLRNQVVTVQDYPDTYAIPFVQPPQQLVTMTVTWNTDSVNVVSTSAIAALAIPAIVAYVNNIVVGQPMNIFVMIQAFQNAVVSVLPAALLTRLTWAVSLNGVAAAPLSGTGLIAGDPESYFYAAPSGINVVQG
jgi:hypothetical protein